MNEMNRLPSESEKIPLFKSWRSWYWLVIGFLILLMILFYRFTKHYS